MSDDLVVARDMILVLALLALGGVLPVEVPERGSADAAGWLRRDEVVERRIGGIETQLVFVDLEAGLYLQIAVAAVDADFTVDLSDPEGELLAHVAGLRESTERISIIAGTSGRHRLELRARDPEAEAGGVRLWIAALRQPSPDDRVRANAEATIHAARAVLRARQNATGEEVRAAATGLERASGLWQQLGQRREQAYTLYELAVARSLLDDNPAALEAARAAEQAFLELGHERGLAMVLGQIGTILLELGDVDGAQEALVRAVPLVTRYGPETERHTVLHNLASMYGNRAEFQRALDLHGEALEQARRIGHDAKELLSLISIASIYRRIGDLARAERQLREVVVLARANGYARRESWAEAELGEILAERGEFDEARAAYMRALEMRREAGDRRGVGIVINDLAQLEGRRGNHEAAVEHFRQAHAIAVELGDRGGIAAILSNLAWEEHDSGDQAAAHASFERVVAMYADLGLERKQAPSLRGMASSSLALGEPARARREAEQAIDRYETIRAELGDAELRARYLAPRRKVFGVLVEALLQLDERHPGEGYLAEAFAASERARARSLLELMTHDDEAAGDSALAARREAVVEELTSIHRSLIAGGIDDARRGELAGHRLRLEDERRHLDSVLRRRQAVAEPPNVSLPEVQARLDEGTALLEYFVVEERSFLFVVTRTDARFARLPGEADLRELVLAARRGLQQPGRRQRSRLDQITGELGAALLDPAVPVLDRHRRLLVVADGPLHLVPFEVLRVDGDEPELVLRRWAVHYAPSVGVLAALEHRSRPAAEPRLLVVADPMLAYGHTADLDADSVVRGVADSRGLTDLPRLEHARGEAASVADLFSEGVHSALVGADATEGRLKAHAALSTATHLHFATHAVVSDSLPAHSCLVLGAAPDGAEDGLLQAFEIRDLDLAAELVVLSACETGLGEELPGEGLLGLTRAFMRAGATAVVVSLWQVQDRSTRELMAAFYSKMQNHDPVEALRRAKLDLIARGFYEHPFYWAPFVITGSPDARR